MGWGKGMRTEHVGGDVEAIHHPDHPGEEPCDSRVHATLCVRRDRSASSFSGLGRRTFTVAEQLFRLDTLPKHANQGNTTRDYHVANRRPPYPLEPSPSLYQTPIQAQKRHFNAVNREVEQRLLGNAPSPQGERHTDHVLLRRHGLLADKNSGEVVAERVLDCDADDGGETQDVGDEGEQIV
jgi:hypothetical protein